MALGNWGGGERRTVLVDIFQQGLQVLLLRGRGLVQPGQHVSDVPAREATACVKLRASAGAESRVNRTDHGNTHSPLAQRNTHTVVVSECE